MNEEFLKGLTLEQLYNSRPDLVATIEDEASSSENARILSIVKYAHQLAVKVTMEPIAPVVLKAINEGLSLDTFTNEVYNVVEEALAKNSKKKNNESDEKLPHLDRARIYQRTHGCGLIDALRATAEPRN